MAGGYWRIGNDNTKYDAASGKYYCVTNPVNLYDDDGEGSGKFITEKTIKIDFTNPYFDDGNGNFAQIGLDCVCDLPFRNGLVPCDFPFVETPANFFEVELNYEEIDGEYVAYVIFKIMSK